MNPIKTIALVMPFLKEGKTTKLWFQTRTSNDNLNGLLELAGGKVESSETPLEAAVREFYEEVDVILPKDDLKLLKIHKHTEVNNFIFYIFGYQSQESSLNRDGWHEVNTISLSSFEGRVPKENLKFLGDILKTL